MREIDEVYTNLCKRLMSDEATFVGNTREINNVMVELEHPEDSIVGVRDISKEYLFGELVWYFTARNSVSFIGTFGQMWKRLTDDGVTNNSAYGYILKKKHGFDQIEKIIQLLKDDPDSRRAVLNINCANENVDVTRDEPCTIALQVFVRNNAVDMTAIMRSNDIWFGFPYDVAFFTTLQTYIARRLGMPVGRYTHFAGSLHMYDRNFNDICNVIEADHSDVITFDKGKFFEHCEMVGDMLDVACRWTDREEVMNICRDCMKTYFGVKEVKIENRDY